jgi:hypothetical protein
MKNGPIGAVVMSGSIENAAHHSFHHFFSMVASPCVR